MLRLSPGSNPETAAIGRLTVTNGQKRPEERPEPARDQIWGPPGTLRSLCAALHGTSQEQATTFESWGLPPRIWSRAREPPQAPCLGASLVKQPRFISLRVAGWRLDPYSMSVIAAPYFVRSTPP